MSNKNPSDPPAPLKAGLYVVATPIGNLADISDRARDTLCRADIVACEDTRVSAKLLHAIGSRARLSRYDDHQGRQARPKLLAAIEEGKSVALISDAGTPMISDPGYKLVAEAHQSGLMVTSIPGASAIITALTLAGLPTDRFLFVGFLPAKASARQRRLEALADLDATLVIYEATRRLADFFTDAKDCLASDRHAAVCREMTKKHEEVVRGSLSELAKMYAGQQAPKGEAVIVIAPPAPAHTADDSLPAPVAAALALALEDMPLKKATTLIHLLTGETKKRLYSAGLTLKGGHSG